jgi:iron(III) transport system permease protein
LLVIAFPLALSSPIIGTSLINLYVSLPIPIYGTHAILIIGYLIKFIPFTVFIFLSFLAQVSTSLEEAGRIFTSSQLKILRKIIIPSIKLAFIASFILSFIFIFGEVAIPQLLSPPGFQVFPLRVDVLMHYGDYQSVASLSLFFSCFIILFSLLYSLILRVW